MSTHQDEAPAVGFGALGLSPTLLETLAALGYEEPTPVQRAAMPALLEGKDVLGQAATGTGKTAAFALPILQRLTPGHARQFEAQALVLVPTRELATQVAEAVQKYGQKLGVRVTAIYGGAEMGPQLRALKRGVDVVVATPGRALDHIRKKSLLLGKVRAVVLDEADEMLDLGFAEDLDLILKECPEERQTALFSATLPKRIAAIAETHLKSPVRVSLGASTQSKESLPKIEQRAYVVQSSLRTPALLRLLDVEAPKAALVFCRTRLDVEALSDALIGHGHHAAALHGGMSQEERESVLRRFKSGKLSLLVATDVAARGLHVDDLSHVVNYELPTSPEVYVHRIGRTGRAGKEGVALTLLTPRESRLLLNVERLTKQKIHRAQVPSAEMVRARHLAGTRARVEEALTADKADPLVDALIEALAATRTPLEVARAAVSALHAQLHPADETDLQDIPTETVRDHKVGDGRGPGPRGAFRGAQRSDSRGAPRPPARSAPRSPARSAPRTAAASHEAPREPARSAPRSPARSAPRAAASGDKQGFRPRPFEKKDGERKKSSGAPMDAVRLFISLGTNVGMRPRDLVGAIANEAGISVKDIGAIRIEERHSTVEVARGQAEKVMEALSMTTLRGRPVKVSKDRGGTYAPPRK
jgi:ATP-dependent RNA helicase DeaD